MAVQLQWSLNATVGTALSIARDVLLAANNDNVQPLAIAACEQFGNTIAMCQDTCTKIESLTARTPAPIAINFIRAYVGFDANDCAVQLSKSQAGVQFLGLAAALVTSLGAFEGGKALYEMLASSALDKTLLPTPRQLKHLLESVEPRLEYSGFLDAVVGWQIFLRQSSAMTPGFRDFLKDAAFYPGLKSIGGLVDAFRQLSRVGEADITKISIRTTDCAPWVIAFTKWCLGLPPSIFLDNGTAVLEQPGSKVDLIMDGFPDPDAPRDAGFVDAIKRSVRISIYRTIGEPSDLVESKRGDDWNGMVSIEKFSQQTLNDLDLDTGMAREALLQAVPFAVKQILQCIKFFNDNSHTDVGLNYMFKALLLVPLPKERVIAQTASHYLATPGMTIPHSLGGILIDDLSAVKAYLRASKKPCLCGGNGRYLDAYGLCHVCKFFLGLIRVCADILALSLFGDVRLPLLNQRYYPKMESPFLDAIRPVIYGEGNSRCGIFSLLEYALDLASHPIGDYSRGDWNWVMSGGKGQVIYPSLYENMCYEKEGYLSLICIPGILRYNGETYNKVLSTHSTIIHREFMSDLSFNTPVKKPLNLYSNVKVDWQVEQCEHHLMAALGLRRSNNSYSVTIPLTGIFEYLSSAILLEACTHDPNAELQSSDPPCEFIDNMAAYESRDPLLRRNRPINVIPVDRDNELRIFSLTAGNYSPYILRKKACLSCCLDVCVKTGYRTIIL